LSKDRIEDLTEIFRREEEEFLNPTERGIDDSIESEEHLDRVDRLSREQILNRHFLHHQQMHQKRYK